MDADRAAAVGWSSPSSTRPDHRGQPQALGERRRPVAQRRHQPEGPSRPPQPARYEVANNSYAKGIVLTLANDTIGTGPRLQMLTGDAEANARIEDAFEQWSRAVDLPGKLRTMRMARAETGEAFALGEQPRHPVAGSRWTSSSSRPTRSAHAPHASWPER